MMFRDIVQLVEITSTVNDIGDRIETEIERYVFANKKGVRQSEFYQANATGLRPQLMFEVRTQDYNGEPRLKHDGVEYNIIRTYDKNGEIIELVVSGLVVG
jgi:SPP1 family predicted phage head-tail adaptor